MIDSSLLNSSFWLLSSSLLILFVLIIFGYHLYQRNRVRALIEDSGDVAELAARKAILQADVQTLRDWIEGQKSELEAIEGERAEQEIVRSKLAQIEQDLAAKRQESQDFFREADEISLQIEIKRNALNQLETEIRELEKNKSEYGELEKSINEMRSQLEAGRARLETMADLDIKISALTQREQRLEENIEKYKLQLEPLHKQVLEYEQNLDSTQQQYYATRDTFLEKSQELKALKKDTEDLRQYNQNLVSTKATLEEEYGDTKTRLEQERLQLNELQREINDIHNKIDEGKSRLDELYNLEIKLSALNQHELILNDAIEKHKRELEPLHQQIKEYEQKLLDAKHELALKKDSIEERNAKLKALEGEEKILIAQKAALEMDIQKLNGQLCGTAQSREDGQQYADLFIEPASLTKSTFEKARQNTSEHRMLESFQKYLRGKNYFFPKRTIHAFHTALKCQTINPLTVLAGVSGTGKTLLPVIYAEFIGMHHLVIPVQPRWDSPQDMFGFYNYLEKKYKATDLSRSLIRMDPYNYNDIIQDDWAHDRMLLVLLDEMNLARTEYYFSEFLSRLELRRLDWQLSQIELDTGPGEERFPIYVPENVLFVGTMNEDESTQSLSDKVLDRSNVLRFGKPGKSPHSAQSKIEKDGMFLSASEWNKVWRKTPDGHPQWREKTDGWLGEINEKLDKAGRPFGFRTIEAINTYLANYPQVDTDENYKLAFADQIEQKVLPRLRGLETLDPTTHGIFNTLDSIINDINDAELFMAFEDSKEFSKNTGMYHWRGVTRQID